MKPSGYFSKAWDYAKGYSLGNVVRDVMWLKQVINAEKKFFSNTNSSVYMVGQVGGATAEGYATWDITPLPTSGAGYASRVGSSLKLVSSVMKLQFWQQGACNGPRKVRILIVSPKDVQSNLTTFASEILFTNKFIAALNGASSVRDYFSQFNPDYRREFRIICDRRMTVPADPGTTGETMIKDVTIPLKMSHHVRYS